MTAPARAIERRSPRAATTGRCFSPAVFVLLAGSLAAVPLIVLSAADAGHLRPVWDDLHWSLTAAAASFATILAVRGTTGRIRAVRVGGATAFALWLGSMLTWADLNARGEHPSPSFADVFVLA